MAIAVVVESSERKELRTCEGGFVVIRRMTYGQKLQRADLTSKMRVQASRKSKDVQGEIDLLQRQVTLWEFANLIADHNLTDARERKLDFKKPTDVEMISGRIGEEISKYIGDLNNFEEDLEDGDTELGN